MSTHSSGPRDQLEREKEKLFKQPNEAQNQRRQPGRELLNGVFNFIGAFFWQIFIGLFGAVSIFFILLLAIFFLAANGGAVLLIGNGLLRTQYPLAYVDNISAVAIGAVGSWATSTVGTILTYCIPADKEHGRPWYISACTTLFLSTLSGPVGRAILVYYRVDVSGIDALHATWAGALGGAIMALPLIPLSRRQIKMMSFTSDKVTRFIERLAEAKLE